MTEMKIQAQLSLLTAAKKKKILANAAKPSFVCIWTVD